METNEWFFYQQKNSRDTRKITASENTPSYAKRCATAIALAHAVRRAGNNQQSTQADSLLELVFKVPEGDLGVSFKSPLGDLGVAPRPKRSSYWKPLVTYLNILCIIRRDVLAIYNVGFMDPHKIPG